MAGGLATQRWNLVLLVQRGDDRSAQKQLDGFLSSGTGSDKSIIDRLATAKTLGGVVNDVLVQTATDYGRAVEIGDMTFGQAVLKAVTHTPRT
jgi:hypothetical protein